MNIASIIIPVFVLGVFLYGLYKKVDVFGEFVSGARENIKVGFGILPSLCALMLAVGMLRESNTLDGLVRLIAPLTEFLGFPPECAPLALLRPVSGSGALSLLEGIFKDYGPDSFIGKVASVMMGSTETTFYTLAVYFAATRVKNTRHALPCALAGDLTAAIMSCVMVRVMLG